ncbi:hypothetical protein TNCV_4354831 [Trichonephila clavipes]|nr:hypothetical protein TNCV_4354831 [Trichonephila clavipes]
MVYYMLVGGLYIVIVLAEWSWLREFEVGFVELQVVLVPLKTPSLIEELMHLKSIEAQILPIGIVWKFGEKDLPNQASSLSLSCGSEIRDLSLILLVFLRIFKAVFPNAGPMGEGGGDKEEFRHPVPSLSTNFVQLFFVCVNSRTIERDRFWQRSVSTKVLKSTVKFYEWKKEQNEPEKKTLFQRKLRESCVDLTSELILLASSAYANKTKSDNKKGNNIFIFKFSFRFLRLNAQEF